MQLTHDRDGTVATITLDDGARNVLDADTLGALRERLDETGDAAVVLTGRPGVLSAGLDLKVIESGSRREIHDLLVALGRTVMALWTHPRPTVCAAGGHAIAAGTMLSMCCDHGVAAEGDFRWGLTETRVGFEVPRFGIVPARRSLRADRVDGLLLGGQILSPREAVEVGYADELAEPGTVLERARERAGELAELPARAYAGTKHRLRGEAADRVLEGLEDDVEALLEALGADRDS